MARSTRPRSSTRGASSTASSRSAPYAVIGAARADRRAAPTVGPHVRDRGPHDDRPRQPHLPVRLDRRARRRTRSTPASRPRLEIGDRNTIREFCTFNIGTVQDAGVTRIGNDNWIMAYVHIAHDCQVGNHTIFANNAHARPATCRSATGSIVGGFTGVHQFVQDRRARDASACPRSRDAGRAAVRAGRRQSGRRRTASTSRACKRRGFTREQIARDPQMHKLLYTIGLHARRGEGRIAALAEAKRAARRPPHVRAACATSSTAPTRGIVR